MTSDLLHIRPCGDQAVLVEVAGTAEVVAVQRRLRADPPPGVLESVPAARTVLVYFDPAITTAARLTGDLLQTPVDSGLSGERGRLVRIPVVYDGPDLDHVADRTGLIPAEVVARHCAPEYQVAFCGFAPGFAYLTGLDPVLRLSRRASPRTRVPAGAVAIADEFSGMYPRPAPGGWHLLGHTNISLWMLGRQPPALLRPGDRVRFLARS